MILAAGNEDLSSSPVVVFYGTDSHAQIRAVNPSGQDIAQFAVHSSDAYSFGIWRAFPESHTAPVELCNSTKEGSSIAISIHKQKIVVKPWIESLSSTYRVESTSIGTLKFCRTTSDIWKLKDDRGTVLARGNITQVKFEILVVGNEITLDIWLALWVALLHSTATKNSQSGSKSSAVRAALLGFKLVGALAGAPIGGN